MTTIDPVSLGILWDRLISITDEIVNALVRTSFSIQRARELRPLLRAVRRRRHARSRRAPTACPSFTGTAPATLRHMLDALPADTLAPAT